MLIEHPSEINQSVRSSDIVDFAANRKPWQQDLLRRISAQTELTEQDMLEVLALLKSEFGLAKAPEALTLFL